MNNSNKTNRSEYILGGIIIGCIILCLPEIKTHYNTILTICGIWKLFGLSPTFNQEQKIIQMFFNIGAFLNFGLFILPILFILRCFANKVNLDSKPTESEYATFFWTVPFTFSVIAVFFLNIPSFLRHILIYVIVIYEFLLIPFTLAIGAFFGIFIMMYSSVRELF